MSMYSVLATTLVLSLTACLDRPTVESQQSTVDQEIGLLPNCPSDQTVLFFTEPFGFCGDCIVNRQVGQLAHQYAACSGDISGTKRFIQNLCSTPCELL